MSDRRLLLARLTEALDMAAAVARDLVAADTPEALHQAPPPPPRRSTRERLRDVQPTDIDRARARAARRALGLDTEDE